jgi:hypothetical protein
MGTGASKARKLILIAFAVIAVGLFASTRSRQTPCPLAIQFVGFTNDAVQAYGVFLVTNRSDMPLEFHAITESKASGSWPTCVGMVLPHNGPYNLGAQETREFRAPLPAALSGEPVCRIAAEYTRLVCLITSSVNAVSLPSSAYSRRSLASDFNCISPVKYPAVV